MRKDPGEAAVARIIAELDSAHPTLTLRTLVGVLAEIAKPRDRRAIEALRRAYERSRNDVFLGPAILDSLALLARRSALARSELTIILHELENQLAPGVDSRFHLIHSARIVGVLDALDRDDELRALLRTWQESAPSSAQAEVRFQIALIHLSDAFLAEGRLELIDLLGRARAAFSRAEASEENRPDARLFTRLLDCVLALGQLAYHSEGSASKAAAVALEVEGLGTLADSWAADYLSPQADAVRLRVHAVADAVARCCRAMGEAEGWTNLEAAVIEVAALCQAIRITGDRLSPDNGVAQVLNKLPAKVVGPTLGHLLSRSVGLIRARKIVEKWEIAGGPIAVIESLRLLEHEMARAAAETTVVADALRSASHLPEVFAMSADRVIEMVLAAGCTNDFRPLQAAAAARNAMLDIDRPDAYSADPGVDEVVRETLHALHVQLGTFDGKKWTELVRLVVEVVDFVGSVREIVPDYACREEDGGLGQRATEDRLRDAALRHLRAKFGYGVTVEPSQVAGGRADGLVAFPSSRYPIEVKREFSRVARGVVHGRFLGQPDVYAACTDRVAFLLVLDLRAENAIVPSGSGVAPRSLYSLRKGCWVDALQVDPDIQGAESNAVVVFLVPGNRPRPFKMSHYSSLPKKGEKGKRGPGNRRKSKQL